MSKITQIHIGELAYGNPTSGIIQRAHDPQLMELINTIGRHPEPSSEKTEKLIKACAPALYDFLKADDVQDRT